MMSRVDICVFSAEEKSTHHITKPITKYGCTQHTYICASIYIHILNLGRNKNDLLLYQ